jgi:hypothetical protein
MPQLERHEYGYKYAQIQSRSAKNKIKQFRTLQHF